MNKAKLGYDRLAKLIQNDKKQLISQSFNDVVKSDIMTILENYFVIINSSAVADIKIMDQNEIDIHFNVKAVRQKELPFYNEKY